MNTVNRLIMIMLAVAIPHPFAGAQTIVAHRGASHDAPENTLAAFRLAWEQRADAVEGDFRLTADGHAVCIHDKTTRRTAGVDLTVETSTLAELRALDVGSWKSPAYEGEVIPTLDEVLAAVPDDKAIYIEIKCGPQIVPALRAALQQRGMPAAQTVVISFHEDVIQAVKRNLPDVPAYWLTGYEQDMRTGTWQPTHDQVMATLARTGADGLGTKAERAVVTDALVQRLRAAGMALNMWTVDEPDDLRWAQRLGVDALTTNRPAAARELLHPPAEVGAPAQP